MRWSWYPATAPRNASTKHPVIDMRAEISDSVQTNCGNGNVRISKRTQTHSHIALLSICVHCHSWWIDEMTFAFVVHYMLCFRLIETPDVHQTRIELSSYVYSISIVRKYKHWQIISNNAYEKTYHALMDVQKLKKEKIKSSIAAPIWIECWRRQ